MYANPYSFSKRLAEHYCMLYSRVYAVPTVIARFFNVYGSRQIEDGAYATVIGVFERQKREGLALTVTGAGEQRRDFTHVDDIVSGLIAMSKNKWEATIFDLGTGINYSINEVAKMFDQPIEYVSKRPGEAEVTLADITQSKKLLRWAPTHSLRAYVEKVLTRVPS